MMRLVPRSVAVVAVVVALTLVGCASDEEGRSEEIRSDAAAPTTDSTSPATTEIGSTTTEPATVIVEPPTTAPTSVTPPPDRVAPPVPPDPPLPEDPPDPFATDVAAARVALDAARQRWQGSGMNGYRIAVARNCFCAPGVNGEFQIEVLDGAIISVAYTPIYLMGGDQGTPRATEDLTVDGLFGVIDRSLSAGALRVQVSYDPSLGFPRSIVIDGQASTTDDEIFYEVRSVQ